MFSTEFPFPEIGGHGTPCPYEKHTLAFDDNENAEILCH